MSAQPISREFYHFTLRYLEETDPGLLGSLKKNIGGRALSFACSVLFHKEMVDRAVKACVFSLKGSKELAQRERDECKYAYEKTLQTIAGLFNLAILQRLPPLAPAEEPFSPPPLPSPHSRPSEQEEGEPEGKLFELPQKKFTPAMRSATTGNDRMSGPKDFIFQQMPTCVLLGDPRYNIDNHNEGNRIVSICQYSPSPDSARLMIDAESIANTIQKKLSPDRLAQDSVYTLAATDPRKSILGFVVYEKNTNFSGITSPGVATPDSCDSPRSAAGKEEKGIVKRSTWIRIDQPSSSPQGRPAATDAIVSSLRIRGIELISSQTPAGNAKNPESKEEENLDNFQILSPRLSERSDGSGVLVSLPEK